MSDLDANKQLVRKLIEDVLNLGNAEHLEQYAASNIVDHNHIILGAPSGPGGAAAGVTAFLEAFPDFRADVGQLVAEGDVVVASLTMRGTNSGPYHGITSPTQQYAEWEAIAIFTIVEGKVTEIRGLTDRMALMTQLGILPNG